MEVRAPVLTEAEIDALLRHPTRTVRAVRTVRQELEAVRAAAHREHGPSASSGPDHAGRSGQPLARSTASLRRLIARALYSAAQAIYPTPR